MCRTMNDFVLKILAQIIKIVAISCHSNNQITILFGMFLCIQQRFYRNHIKLNMMTIHPEIATHKASKLCNAIFVIEERRRKFLVKQRATCTDMIELGCRTNYSGRSFGISTLYR